MNRVNWLSVPCALTFLAISQQGVASPPAKGAPGNAVLESPVRMYVQGAPVPKSAGAQTLGARATVTQSATLYGGFQLTSTALVYILVRGNSLGTLGVTQAYLDAPRVRVYDGQGVDLIFDNSGTPGFNACTGSGTYSAPVSDYYTFTRGQPAHARDACTSLTLAPGAYTFTVTPSIAGETTTNFNSSPPYGEVLFEVTLNP